jgi:phosphoglycerate dehydrogenase-like enzyme
MKKKAILLAQLDNGHINQVFDEQTQVRMQELVELNPVYMNESNLELHQESLQEVEIAFSTWGIPKLTEEQIKQYLPNLKIVLYGAGSVQAFARTYLGLDIQVVSSWAANAVPVAEYTVAQIILASKGFYQTARLYKVGYKEAKSITKNYTGNYDNWVGILGAGMIGKKVIELLGNYNINVKVFDPFLPEEKAVELGVHKTDLVDIFSTCETISNHLANLPTTVGILNKEHFNCMLPHATFINTGRGAQVVEADLIQAMRDEPLRTALLDVTFPEPVQEDSEFLKLDNVILTPHIAGSMNNEVSRMGLYAVDECERYLKGEKLLYGVTEQMLLSMA